jgi:hypothetical protein
VGSSHGGTADGVGSGGTSDPGAENVDTWCENIKDRSIVGEACSCIVGVNGTDRDGVWCGGWGNICGVLLEMDD